MDSADIALDIIARVSGTERDRITPDLELVAHLGIDSAKALELLVELEDRIGIEIDDDDAAQLNTVGDILAYLDRMRRAAS
jgi:acyl carrier protein